jgi:predicted nucleic acid-binding protein
MIAVSDTSPICYLILIGDIDILPKLFDQVLVPRAVLAELCHEDAPEAVRDWAANPPTWITVQEEQRLAATGVATGLEKLQAGESRRYSWHNRPVRMLSCSTRSQHAALPPPVACE